MRWMLAAAAAERVLAGKAILAAECLARRDNRTRANIKVAMVLDGQVV